MTSNGGGLSLLTAEAAKVPAFVRRDFLQAWSYRMSFVTDAFGLVLQAAIFFFISKLVDPATLPTFGGGRVTYFEFAIIGIAVGMLMGVGLFRAAAAFRKEQLMGTLELLLMTPTAPATIQAGSVAYDLLYVPLRTAIFFVGVAFVTGVNFDASGIPLAILTLVLFLPFVWGLGIMYAAATLTFKVSGGGLMLTVLTITSGAYFPLALLPDWLAAAAEFNPMTRTVDTMREALLGDAGWADVASTLALLAPASLLTLTLAMLAYRAAMRRERRRGSLGLY